MRQPDALARRDARSLVGLPRGQAPEDTAAAADDATAPTGAAAAAQPSDGEVAETPEQATSPGTGPANGQAATERRADANTAAPDPRIPALEALRFMIECRAALEEQLATARKSTAIQRARLTQIETEGLGREPPIPIGVLDALNAEHVLL